MADAAAQVTVLSIAALKKVSKGTRILLLDRSGGQAKTIAKALSKKGFKKVFRPLPVQEPFLKKCSPTFISVV